MKYFLIIFSLLVSPLFSHAIAAPSLGRSFEVNFDSHAYQVKVEPQKIQLRQFQNSVSIPRDACVEPHVQLFLKSLDRNLDHLVTITNGSRKPGLFRVTSGGKERFAFRTAQEAVFFSSAPDKLRTLALIQKRGCRK